MSEPGSRRLIRDRVHSSFSESGLATHRGSLALKMKHGVFPPELVHEVTPVPGEEDSEGVGTRERASEPLWRDFETDPATRDGRGRRTLGAHEDNIQFEQPHRLPVDPILHGHRDLEAAITHP